MVGPSGVDQAAPDTPHMLDDTFRVFAAASQGDWKRARSLLPQLSDRDLWGFIAMLEGLADHARTEERARRSR